MTDPIATPKNKKILFWVCSFAWIALTLAGYSVYRHSVKRFHQEAQQTIVHSIRTAGGDSGYRKAMVAIQNLAGSELPAYIDLGEQEEVEERLDEAASRFSPQAAITLLNKDGTVLARRGNSPVPLESIIPLAEVSGIDTGLLIPVKGEIFAVFSDQLMFFQDNVARIKVCLPTGVNSPLGSYLMVFILWSVLLAPGLIAVGVLVSKFAGHRSQTRAVRRAGEEKARDMLQLFSQLQALYSRKDRQENAFGQYILSHLIAKGGMAELFIAKKVGQYGFEKTVVLKKILPHLSDQAEFIAMFIEEAKRSAILDHSNIVRTDDFGEIAQTDDHGREKKEYFISMEFVQGKNLQELLKELGRAFPIDASCFIASQVCRGLEYAHGKGIIHRDISPHNIMISFEGDVKITDFGISKASTDISLTQTGVIKGHIGYMSPEQIQAKELGPQTDIYSLGIVFYEMLSGRKLYKFGSLIEAVNLIPVTEIAPIQTIVPGISNELNHIVMTCLEKDRSERFQHIGQVAERLEDHMRDATVVYSRSDLAKFMKQHFKETHITKTGGQLNASLVWQVSRHIVDSAVANTSEG